MKMHVFLKSLPIAILAFFLATALHAQTDQPAPTTRPAKEKVKARYHQNNDELAKELNLTEEQKAKFKQIDEEHATKVKAKRAANKEEAAKQREEHIKARKSVLTPEQAAKYDEIQAKKQAKREEKKTKKAEEKSERKAKKSEKKAIKKELDKQ